jgi:hypothetical protein
MKRLAALVLLLVAGLMASTQFAHAQDATPVIDLATPTADECTVDPHTADEVEGLVGSTGEATAEIDLATPNTDAATPTPFIAPEGTPVTEGDAFDAIDEVVTQFYACQNANDTMRMFALMTDEFVVRTIQEGDIDPAAFANTGTPTTDMVASEQVTIDVNGVIEIEADIYGVNVVGIEGSSGEEFTDYLIVVRDGDRYLIDELENLS